MRRIVVCVECEEKRNHRAFGLCDTCYGRYYRRNNSEKINAYQRQWRKENPKKAKAIWQRHYYNNREGRIDSVRRWREKNLEKVRLYSYRYRQRHPDCYRRWRQNNPEKAKAKEARKRARKEAVPTTLKGKDAEVLLNTFLCFYCGGNGKLVLDHFVPLSKGGGTTRANMVVACEKCNSSKSDKLPSQLISQLVLV